MDDFDILTFGRPSKASYKDAHKAMEMATSATVSNPCSSGSQVSSQSESNNSSCEYDSDNDGKWRHGRVSKRKCRSHLGGKVGSLASSLIHNKPVIIESRLIRSDSEESDSSPSAKKKIKEQIVKSSVSNLDDSLSRSPSPLPSPPPPGSNVKETLSDRKSNRALRNATYALNQLIYSTPGSDNSLTEINDSFSSIGSASKEDSITLRIRYKGKIHKYTVNKSDPFSIISSLLASELGVTESNKFSFSHKTVTIREKDSPLSLGLSTADILDAFMVNASLNDSLGEDSITIKVQSSSKSKMYSLCRKDPLQKVIQAFAQELDVSLASIQLYFDGVPISPSQTADDLDMDDDDCIDARLTSL